MFGKEVSLEEQPAAAAAVEEQPAPIQALVVHEPRRHNLRKRKTDTPPPALPFNDGSGYRNMGRAVLRDSPRKPVRPVVPQTAPEREPTDGWCGGVTKWDPGPLRDGSGPLTMVRMKFEFWASVRAGKTKQTVWNCPASQFYEQLEDGSFVYSEATRDAVTRAKQVYKVQADAQKGRWSPIMHSTKCSSPWEPFVEFLEEADLGELDVVIGQANLATDALRKVHFRASVGKHCVLGLKNQDSQSLRTVKFTVALPAEIFVGLFLYSRVCSYVSQPWVTGPNKVSWCSLPVPPSTCKPGVGLHEHCPDTRQYVLHRQFYPEELTWLIDAKGYFISEHWPSRKYWLGPTRFGECVAKGPVTMDYSFASRAVTVHFSYHQLNSAGDRLP